MNELKMIYERHSVRSYSDKKIEGEVLDKMMAAIDELQQESGIRIEFRESSRKVFTSPMMKLIGWKGDPGYIVLAGKDTDELDENCGYYGEKLVLYLQSIGLNTCWVGMFKKGGLDIVLSADERPVITIAVGYGNDSGKPHKSKTINEVCDISDISEAFRNGVDAALAAPTAVNQQKFKISSVDGQPVITADGKGPFIKVDLGIVKYNFEVGYKNCNE
ncbi:MAG: nitroreductase family protein [Clostridiales bacterium]|nr:nitroreductase family protein [Candidatus Crickella equi]